MIVVDYIVQYTDNQQTVDGAVKTRHFESEEAAWRHIEWLSTYSPHITDTILTKQTSKIDRKRLN